MKVSPACKAATPLTIAEVRITTRRQLLQAFSFRAWAARRHHSIPHSPHPTRHLLPASLQPSHASRPTPTPIIDTLLNLPFSHTHLPRPLPPDSLPNDNRQKHFHRFILSPRLRRTRKHCFGLLRNKVYGKRVVPRTQRKKLKDVLSPGSLRSHFFRKNC